MNALVEHLANEPEWYWDFDHNFIEFPLPIDAKQFCRKMNAWWQETMQWQECTMIRSLL